MASQHKMETFAMAYRSLCEDFDLQLVPDQPRGDLQVIDLTVALVIRATLTETREVTL